MSGPTYYGVVYIGTALGEPHPGPGSSNIAAISILGDPDDETRPMGGSTRIERCITTNPQAVALGILWALQVLGPQRWGTIFTNLDGARMDVPKALRRAADVEARQKSGAPAEDPRSFPALMDRVAVAIAASLRSEVCYASVDNSALLQRARQNARTALGKALLEGKEHP